MSVEGPDAQIAQTLANGYWAATSGTIKGHTIHELTSVVVHLVEWDLSSMHSWCLKDIGLYDEKHMPQLPLKLSCGTWPASCSLDVCDNQFTDDFGPLMMDWPLLDVVELDDSPGVHNTDALNQELWHAFLSWKFGNFRIPCFRVYCYAIPAHYGTSIFPNVWQPRPWFCNFIRLLDAACVFDISGWYLAIVLLCTSRDDVLLWSLQTIRSQQYRPSANCQAGLEIGHKVITPATCREYHNLLQV